MTKHGLCSLVARLLLSLSTALAQTAENPQDSAAREARTGTIQLQQGNYADAKEHFEKAQSLLGKPTAETSAGIGLAELQMGHYASAREMFKVELQLLTNDHARAQAHYMIGSAWLREAGNFASDKDKLQAAEQSFREAVKFDPVYDLAYFNLGYALLAQDKRAESDAAFKDFVRTAAENPESARNLPVSSNTRAPQFSVLDSGGRPLSSESLRGRFVLLDFWATWCPPCIRALPAMRQLSQFFHENQFLLVSVNEDVNDRDAWRRFSRAHDMDWAQTWDEHSSLYHAFGLAASSDLSLPRYVLVDKDGYVRHVYSGTDQLGLVVGQVVRTVRTELHMAATK
ncbi:MAG TPA: redoxin family protein [Candidatus Sulfotelmatobacter sp.]|nr:redoxin family protein [Candidatus Sulfotelmatobacter sp.]